MKKIINKIIDYYIAILVIIVIIGVFVELGGLKAIRDWYDYHNGYYHFYKDYEENRNK